MFNECTSKINVFSLYDQHLYTIYSTQPIENLAEVNILITRESKEYQKVLRVTDQLRVTDKIQAGKRQQILQRGKHLANILRPMI